MADSLISIDLGTTHIKVAAFACDGSLRYQLARRHAEHGDAGASGQRADDWWRDACALLRELAKTVDPREVHGISLCGRGGAGVFADAEGEVRVHPWSDRRHEPQRRRLAEQVAPARLAPYTAALLAKHMWLRETSPALCRRLRYAFYAKDFLLFRLTGVHCTDWSSGPDGPAWQAAALEVAEVPASLLPAPELPWTLAGALTPAAAAATGLPAGLPVAVGGHDGICANVGAGAARPGDWALTLGTHGVVRAVAAKAPAGAHRFYTLPPDRHVIGGNALMGGRAPEWLLDFAGPRAVGQGTTLAEMDARAEAVPVGADGVRFLPYLAGQVAPAQRPQARAVLAGMTVRHGGDEAFRAVLEGAAFALADVYRQVRSWCGAPQRLCLTGSGARSTLWAHILAAVLEQPLVRTDAAVEGRGAAAFLAVALGLYPDYDTAADSMRPTPETIEPDPPTVAAYTPVYADWSRLAQHVQTYDDTSKD